MADTPKEERVVRHPNGHLAVERAEAWTPTCEQTAKLLASCAKAWPVLAEHASHIDGEFDNALSDLRRGIEAFHAYVERVRGAAAPPAPARPRSTEGLALVALAKAWLVAMADASKDVWPDRAAFVSKLSWMPHDVLARFLVETEDHVAAVVAGAQKERAKQEHLIATLRAENARLRDEFAASQQGGT